MAFPPKKGGPALLIGFGEPKGGADVGEEEESSRALAGVAFAKALGIKTPVDGEAIADAFDALARESMDHDEDDEPDMDASIAAE